MKVELTRTHAMCPTMVIFSGIIFITVTQHKDPD
jgi:hypothetical protein